MLCLWVCGWLGSVLGTQSVAVSLPWGPPKRRKTATVCVPSNKPHLTAETPTTAGKQQHR